MAQQLKGNPMVGGVVYGVRKLWATSLLPSASSHKITKSIKGVIWDLDGTLTVPYLDFALMRRKIGVPTGDVLKVIETFEPERREKAHAIIKEWEEDGRRNMKLQPGVASLIDSLREADVRQAIVTRNNAETLEHFLDSFEFAECFEPALSREFTPCKPAPHPALHVCSAWEVDPSRVLFVGDGVDDMLCGHAAGNITALLLNDHNRANRLALDHAHLVVETIDELRAHLTKGLHVRIPPH
eukprot:CAMPEP_0177654254 /NCGR_PEP_ID=MMETSP0447-20121125/14215_1 /TAXON_ID=0 /ORGANISM="Stygamoeba regulata, Strain BSH-02190019" /LENGTH=240 /DNA_ID=CAMNT_0019157853 /DNA_START=110 /DNA_END=832 /DNA_ORIENTATION=+